MSSIKVFFAAIENLLVVIGHFCAEAYSFIQESRFFSTNLFNFILVTAFFVWLLFYFIDIVNIFDKKSKETAKTIADAENKKVEAQRYLSDTQKSIANVDNEVKDIISEAKNFAQNIENNSQHKLSEELANLRKREEILKSAQISKARDEISATIANAALAVSKEYIKNTLDEKMHRELIINFINDLDEGMDI